MSLIEHVWPWDAQPQEAVRLRRELADAALVYLPGTHPTAILSASGLPIAPLTTAAPLVVTPSGYAVQQQQQSQFSRAAAGLPTNAPELTLWVVSANGAAYANSGGDRSVFGIAGGSTFLGFQNWAGGLKFLASVYYYPDYNGMATAESASGVVRPNSTQIVVATYRRNDAVRLYVGGVKVAESAAGDYDGGFNWSTMSIGNSVTQMTGTPAAAGILLRALSDSDIATMFSDPWAFIAPSQNRVPTASAAPSMPTLSLPTVTAIGATQATPRVTLTY